MYRIRQAASGIFMVTRTLGPGRSGSSVNSIVLAGREGLIFDPGYGSWKPTHPLVRALKKIGQGSGAVTRAMASHSHWDHFSGLGALQDQMGLEILATRPQTRVITSKRFFKETFRRDGKRDKGIPGFLKGLGGEALMTMARIGFVKGPVTLIPEDFSFRIRGRTWQVIPAPGHCDDDIVLYNRDEGILLGGDLVLRTINTWLGPPRSDMKVYLQSLGMLRDLPGLKLILPAHGSPVTDPVRRIDAIISRRRQKAVDLLDLIASAGDRGMDIHQLGARVLPKGPRFQRYLSFGMLEATLAFLEGENRLSCSRMGRRIRYRT